MRKFELIDQMERFRELEAVWKELWLAGEMSVFQSHPWIGQCEQFLSRSYRLHIGVLWEDARLVAVVPCAIRRTWGLRVLEWAGQEYSDNCDGLGESIDLKECWDALLSQKAYDIIRMKYVRTDAACAGLFHDHEIANSSAEQCLVLRSTWPSGDAWMRAHYPKARNSYSRGLRKLEEMGRVEVEFHDVPPDGVVEHLRCLKLEWARRQGIAAPLVEDKNMLNGLVDALVATKCLLLVIVKCNDEIVASSINVVHGKRLLSYFTVYDPRYDRASPGIILLTECLRWAFNNGFMEHDHLRGVESYKQAFANTSVQLNGYTGSGTAYGRTALALRRLRETVPRMNLSLKQSSGLRGPALASAGPKQVQH